MTDPPLSEAAQTAARPSATPPSAALPSEELSAEELPAEAAAPRHRRRPHPRAVIAAVTALVVLASGAWAISQWPAPVASGPAADFAAPDPDSPWLPDYVPDSARYPHAWTAMNEALRAKDRDAFLSYAEGTAREHLALWWDNTTQIGWETAYIVPALGGDGGEGAFLGADLAFSSRPLRGSGDADAGYRLTQGFGYDITTRGSGDDLRITEFDPQTPMPWDEGPIHVAKREHVVLYGMDDEKALVEANIDTAEEGAVLAIEAITDLGGTVPMVGFVSGITDDAERMERWLLGGAEQEGDMLVAGYAQSTQRPIGRSDLFKPDIAVGEATSGVQVMMGPLSADQRLSTFTHEFAHGLHYAAAPMSPYDAPSTAVHEGFATYVELRTGLIDDRWLADPRVQDLVAARGATAMSDESLREEDAWLSYLAAGSYYLFVAERGGDPWRLALDGARSWDRSLIDLAGGAEFDETHWRAWLQDRVG